MKQPLSALVLGRVLTDSIADNVRAAILDGNFAPGEKIDQDGIARQLGVSRTPVREAMRVLESERFICIRPHHGAFISALSRRDIEEIYTVRQLLEPELFRQVAEMIPQALLDSLAARLRQTKADVEHGDLSSHFETDTYFEETILGLCQNGVLKEVLFGLKNRFALARSYALRQMEPELFQSIDDHLAILTAMAKRDPDRVAALTRHHLQDSQMRIKYLAGVADEGTDAQPESAPVG